MSGVRQGCVLSLDSFATDMDYLLETAVGIGMNGISFGDHSYTDLDFADDVCLLAEVMELLVPVLEALATEVESLGLEVNWQKVMLQALGNIPDVPLPSQCWIKKLAHCLPGRSHPLTNSQLSRQPQTECNSRIQ